MFILVSKITYAVQYFCNFKSHEMILTKNKVRKKNIFFIKYHIPSHVLCYMAGNLLEKIFSHWRFAKEY